MSKLELAFNTWMAAYVGQSVFLNVIEAMDLFPHFLLWPFTIFCILSSLVFGSWTYVGLQTIGPFKK